MYATKHKVEAAWPIGYDEIRVIITFTFLKGAPEQGPSYASGGQPADPDEIEFVSAKLFDEHTPSPFFRHYLNEWAAAWLADEGEDAARDAAFDDDESAREDAAERRAEQARERL